MLETGTVVDLTQRACVTRLAGRLLALGELDLSCLGFITDTLGNAQGLEEPRRANTECRG